MAKQKYYVVWEGKAPGIYDSWVECKDQIDHFPNAKYKSYPTYIEAKAAYENGWKQELYKKALQKKPLITTEQYNANSICVDVGSSGNPGVIEYRGVDTNTGEIVFYKGPIQKGTNNLGEFLAIVHALALLKKQGSSKIIYSDSQTAIKWVQNKEVKSNLERDESTAEIWGLVDRALKWLRTNNYSTPVLKWNTEAWGEIKADFGRK